MDVVQKDAARWTSLNAASKMYEDSKRLPSFHNQPTVKEARYNKLYTMCLQIAEQSIHFGYGYHHLYRPH